MNRYAVVLAAGKGTRMKSKLYKVMHPVMGKPMVGHVVSEARKANVDKVVTITGFGAEVVKDYLGDSSEYALQEEQLGTAHAVMQAGELLQDQEGTTIVLSGDTPLLTAETLSNVLDYHEQQNAKATVLTAHAENPFGYGRVIRSSDNSVEKIVEQKDASEEEQKVQEINTGTYAFDNKALFETLSKVDNDNAQGEYYLPDVIEILQKEQEIVAAYQLDDMDEALGVNDRVALSQASKLMKKRINEKHMRNGVTFVDAENTYIESNVEIGSDTLIEPGVYLKGNTKIGEDVIIGAHSIITDSEIADNVEIKQSVLENAKMAKESDIGPFGRLRKGADVRENAHVGNFVEIKKAVLGKGSKAGHLSYIGDAEVGENVNIGCGTTFVNYDGKNKHKTIVGDNSFVGSGTNLVAPITLGEGAFTAAGSTITEDVPENSLAFGRARQVTKEGYNRDTSDSDK